MKKSLKSDIVKDGRSGVMEETPEERKKREQQELIGKNIAYHAALYGGWFQSKMERDKTLIALSSGGIGLLVTILMTVRVNCWWELGLFAVALVGFGICIWSSLEIFRLNPQYIERVLKNKDSSELELEKHDTRSLLFFMFGVFCFCLIGITTALENFETREVGKMGNEKEITSVSTGNQEKSVHDVQKIRPEQPSLLTQPDSSQQPDSSSGTQAENSESGQAKE